MKFTVTLVDNIYRKNIRLKDLSWGDIADIINNPVKSNSDKRLNPAMLGGVCEWETENGKFKNKSEKVINRQLLMLDCEHITDNAYFTESVYNLIHIKYKAAYARYTTASCTELDRRYRIIIPLSRPVNESEYASMARSIMHDIGETYFDPVSELTTQWMFLPAKKDNYNSLYMGQCFNGQPLNVDMLLNIINDNKVYYDEYKAYRPDGEDVRTKTVVVNSFGSLPLSEVGDPRTKMSIVGSFCKAFTISEAIEYFNLPYTRVSENLYKFSSSTHPAGAKVFNEDLLMMTFHTSDPAYEITSTTGRPRPINAFDLVKIHKYNGNYIEMIKEIEKLPEVMEYENKRRRQYQIMQRLKWYDEKGYKNIKTFKLNDGSYVSEEEVKEVRNLYIVA